MRPHADPAGGGPDQQDDTRGTPDGQAARGAFRSRVGFGRIEAAVRGVLEVRPEVLHPRGRWRNDVRRLPTCPRRKCTGLPLAATGF